MGLEVLVSGMGAGSVVVETALGMSGTSAEGPLCFCNSVCFSVGKIGGVIGSFESLMNGEQRRRNLLLRREQRPEPSMRMMY